MVRDGAARGAAAVEGEAARYGDRRAAVIPGNAGAFGHDAQRPDRPPATTTAERQAHVGVSGRGRAQALLPGRHVHHPVPQAANRKTRHKPATDPASILPCVTRSRLVAGIAQRSTEVAGPVPPGPWQRQSSLVAGPYRQVRGTPRRATVCLRSAQCPMQSNGAHHAGAGGAKIHRHESRRVTIHQTSVRCAAGCVPGACGPPLSVLAPVGGHAHKDPRPPTRPRTWRHRSRGLGGSWHAAAPTDHATNLAIPVPLQKSR